MLLYKIVHHKIKIIRSYFYILVQLSNNRIKKKKIYFLTFINFFIKFILQYFFLFFNNFIFKIIKQKDGFYLNNFFFYYLLKKSINYAFLRSN